MQELLEVGLYGRVCCIQESKYTKCNGPHLTEHHHHFAWYCKANDKINPPRLETKKGEPCLHLFKYLNCKGNHLTDFNKCPFWKHCFNKGYLIAHKQICQAQRNQEKLDLFKHE